MAGRTASVIAVLLAWIVWAGCDRGESPAARSDGAKTFLVVSGDTDGWITPCGCTSNQSGGLLRRGTYLKQLVAQGNVVYADAGGAIAGDSDYHRVKFEYILRGELAMGVAAHNVGRAEAALGPEFLRDISNRLQVPLISANAADATGEAIAPPTRIVEAGGKRIAFIGVLSPSFATDAVRISDAQPAIQHAIASLKEPHDLVVVLAYLPEEELQRLAAAIPEADAVIGGPTGQAIAPRRVGPTLLAASTNKGKFLVQIDASARELTGSVGEMTSAFADDPAQQANLKEYLAELARRDFTPAQSGFVDASLVAGSTSARYRIAGSAACQSCHASAHASWSAANHAHAFTTLAGKGFHVDSYCQQCHTTGYGLPGGFVSAKQSGATLGGVGCENCHGPSAAHVADPKVRTAFAASAADQCVRCHDHENSPRFDYATYWPRIKHVHEPKQ